MQAYELAKAFAEEINSQLTAEQVDQINVLNAAETDKNICHSHDFTDANQVMIDAMATLGMEWDNTEEINTLTNEAWEIAKRNEFSPSLIENDQRGMESHG
jgi:hypothetical protein